MNYYLFQIIINMLKMLIFFIKLKYVINNSTF